MIFKVRILFILSLLFLSSGCVFKADEVKLKGFDRTSVNGGKSEDPIVMDISAITLENDQLKITGNFLDSATQVKLDDHELSILSQSANELILSSSSVLNLALNTAMNLVLTNAYGQSVTPVQFNLVDGSVTASKIADDAITTSKIEDGAVTGAKLSDMSAGIGQVLKFNGTTWVPGDLSSLTYAGNWDATGNSPDLSGGGNLGEFYIVNNAGTFDLAGGAGTNSWAVGDWAVWNNVQGQWEKIDNATNVQSFNGRSGAVTAATNDYTWNQIDKTISSIADIADVDTTGVTDGKILKYQSGTWVIADDLSSGGAGSVSTSEIADGTITNADINAAAAIDQSKINGLPALASSVSTNTSDIATNASNITSNDSDIATNTSAISTNTTNISTLSTTVGTKAASATILTAGDGLSGGGDLSTDRTFSVNVDNTTLEIATDTLQVKNVPDTKLTTACADGEVLSASSGTFTCTASTTIGNWTLNSPNLYYNSGYVGVGTSTPTSGFELVNNVADGLADDMRLTVYESSQTASSAFVLRKARGTEAAPEGVLANDSLGSLGWMAHNGTSWSWLDGIRLVANADFATSVDTRMILSVKSGGIRNDALSILPSGNVGIGTISPATKLDVNGAVSATSFTGDGSLLTNVAATSTSQVNAGAGLVATPSITFSGDTDTGFYQASSGSNAIDVTVGGTQIFNFSSSGIVSPTTGGGAVSSAVGYAGAPTYSFAGDSDTGWYRPAADTLAASTGGTERIRLLSSGNIGIGTTNPVADLDVVGTRQDSITTTNAIFKFGGGDVFLYGGAQDGTSGYNYPIMLQAMRTSDSQPFPITLNPNGGRVGIGTMNPSELLDVDGAVKVTGIPLDTGSGTYLARYGADPHPNTDLASLNNVSSVINNVANGGNGGLAFDRWYAGAYDKTWMYLSQSGNVGIGRTSPSAKLDVESTGGETIIMRDNDNVHTDVSFASYLRSRDSAGTSVWYLGDGSSSQQGTWLLNYQAYPIHLATSGTTRMTVDGTGNVGIGTTSPRAALEVNGPMVSGGGGQGTVTQNIASYFTSDASTTEYIHIRLPFNTYTRNGMYHISVKGYAYNDALAIDLTFVGYSYVPTNTLQNTNIINANGAFSPTQYVGSDNNIYLRFKPSNVYYTSFRVDSMYVGNGAVLTPGEVTVTKSSATTL